jgi:hypothetical protein
MSLRFIYVGSGISPCDVISSGILHVDFVWQQLNLTAPAEQEDQMLNHNL